MITINKSKIYSMDFYHKKIYLNKAIAYKSKSSREKKLISRNNDYKRESEN